MITRLSLIFITLFFTLLPIFSQTKEEVKVELKFSIDTRFGLAKGLFRKSSLLIKDRKQGTGIVEIDVASIDTNNSMRDNHLRDEDFFSVQKFPKAEFEILSLTESSADTVSGNGKLLAIALDPFTMPLLPLAIPLLPERKDKFSKSLKVKLLALNVSRSSIKATSRSNTVS